MAAAALPRAPPAARRRAPARAHPERARLGAFAALGMFAGAALGRAHRSPPQGGDMLLSLLIALAGAGALIALPAQAGPTGSGAPPPASWPSCCSSSPCSSPACRCGCSAAPVGRPRGRACTQGISSTPAITVPYRGIDEWVRIAILSGGTALLALAALLAFWPRRGDDAGLPDRRGGRPGHPLRGPDHRARARLAVLRRRCCSASCSPASCGSSACAPTRWPSPRPAWWPRPSSGRSSRRAWTARRPWFNYEASPRSSSPTRPRRSRGRTATGR